MTDAYTHIPVVHHPFAINVSMPGEVARWRVFCRACGDGTRPADIGLHDFADQEEALVVVDRDRDAR